MVTDTIFTPEQPPVNAVITLLQAKRQLNFGNEADVDHDEMVQEYIDASICQAEDYANAHFYEKTMVLVMNKMPKDFCFNAYPLQEIESIEYYPPGSSEVQTLAIDKYYVTKQNIKTVRLVVRELPEVDDERPDAVKITAKIGFKKSALPATVKQAVKLMVSDMYERREDRQNPATITKAQNILRPLRKYT